MLGIDGAVAYTFVGRLVNIVSSVGTVLLIVRFLSPVEQGYYYTLLSLVALQVVFELGFSFVILQLAAHESALLKIYPDGRIEGDSNARSRLASVLQLTVRWYFRAALALAFVLLPVGVLFFSRKVHAGDQVSWMGPWIAAVIAVSGTFLLTPLCSFLEGCNQVRQVARLRMCQAFVVLAMSWATIASGYGLYACALVNLGWIAACLIFLVRRRRLLISLLRFPVSSMVVSWHEEIWPFQWRIAISWICSYFTMQVFTPILFASRGPLEAGKMGLTLSIVGYIPILALCWVTPKAAPFGRLVKFGQFDELDALFSRTLKQSLVLILLLSAACFAAVLGTRSLLPKIAARMESPTIFALLLLAAVCSFLVQSMAIYLRSFKREPYLVQSLVVSGLTLSCILVAAPRWGSMAIAIIYLGLGGVVALIWASTIFRRFRDARPVTAGS
jgi:hypothetical protein